MTETGKRMLSKFADEAEKNKAMCQEDIFELREMSKKTKTKLSKEPKG